MKKNKKTPYCNYNCKREKYERHDAICIYQRRDTKNIENFMWKFWDGIFKWLDNQKY